MVFNPQLFPFKINVLTLFSFNFLLYIVADQENDNLTPRIIIHKTPDASNQNSNSKDQKSCSNFFLDVAEELEKGVISKEISMLSVSENNCSKESNEDSNDMGRVSKFKKNHLKVITNLVEESDFSERKNHERKGINLN